MMVLNTQGQLESVDVDSLELSRIYHEGFRITDTRTFECFCNYLDRKSQRLSELIMPPISDYQRHERIFLITSQGIRAIEYTGERYQMIALINGLASFDFIRTQNLMQELFIAMPADAFGAWYKQKEEI